MKSILICLSFFLSLSFAYAQNIDIPDANFKSILTSFPCWDSDNDGALDSDIDTNDDGNISIEEAENVQNLNLGVTGSPMINNLSGIEFFVNLTSLEMRTDNLGTLDLSQNSNLIKLEISQGNLTSIDVSQLINLEELMLFSNNISSIDISQLVNLKKINLNNNPLNSLDVSSNIELTELFITATMFSSVDLSNNVELSWLNASGSQITSIDLTNNVNLSTLYLSDTPITAIDLNLNVELGNLILDNTAITQIDLSQNLLLHTISLNYCQIASLDVSQNTNIYFLNIKGNTAINDIDVSMLPQLNGFGIGETTNILELDLSNNPLLFQFEISNSNIERIFMKNGVGASLGSNNLYFQNCPNLEYICANDFDIATLQAAVTNTGSSNVTINTYCSFTPGGEFYTIQGENKIDSNTDGCDVSDSVFPFLKFSINSSSDGGIVVASESGSYNIPLQGGNHELTPQFENPLYYTASPSSVIVNFLSDVSPLIQDFCVTPNGDFNDLEVVIIPLEQARPGFDTNYKLIYKNKGTTILSGNVDLSFSDDFMNLVLSSPNVDNQMLNQLSWVYNNLQPFETREIDFTMNLNTPTDADFPLNGNDTLVFTAAITPNDVDEIPNDNVFTLNQTVVNSFDPNNKTCLEGDIIREEMVGDYVHYMIRFENTGTASAINVVVRDDIDMSTYDINTLVPLDASHDFVTRIQNSNKVEFIFENINLPFDDANNDGYVTFKIKTLETLTIGDTFSNDAEIYFDFNAPIITNDYVTTVEDNLSVDDLNLSLNVKLYPNPVNDVLSIASEVNIEKASIYDVNGRLIQTVVFYGNKTQTTVDLQQLAGGVYVIKLSAENGELTQNFIKE